MTVASTSPSSNLPAAPPHAIELDPVPDVVDAIRVTLNAFADLNLTMLEMVLPWDDWAALKERLGDHAVKMVPTDFAPWVFQMMGPRGPVTIRGRR
jgi:hypothetical protein